eukprot:PhF_6_TR35046/c0_g1_i1/m.51067
MPIMAFVGVAMVTGAVVGAASDIICQCIEISAKKRRADKVPQPEDVPPGFVVTSPDGTMESINVDGIRVVRFSVIMAASNAIFQGYLNVLQDKVTTTGIVATLEKLAITQLTFNPIYYSSVLALNTMWHEGSCEQVPTIVKKELWTVQTTGYMVYIPFDLLRFSVIPPNLQVATGNVVDLGFNVFLTYRANTDAFHVTPEHYHPTPTPSPSTMEEVVEGENAAEMKVKT